MFRHAFNRLALRLLVLVAAAGAPFAGRADNGTPQVRDEWAPIDRIVIQTQPNQTLNPIVEFVVGAAVGANVRVVIVDGDANQQQALVNSLKTKGLIQRDSQVQLTNTPHLTEWARDEAPLTTYNQAGKSSLASMVHKQEDVSQGVGKDVAAAIGQTYKGLSTITYPPGTIPPTAKLFLDGGDFMTTNGGKDLLTTTNLYSNNGADDAATKQAVNDALKSSFGITKVVDLEPLKKDAPGYQLSNAHVDLMVRTLPKVPNNQHPVIVATVPQGDPQQAIITANIQKLKAAGYTVIEVPNAPKGTSTGFKTYTNALFLNKTVVIPKYNDQGHDAAALQAYDTALNGNKAPNDPTRFKIVQVDASGAAAACGGPRCAARELGQAPSRPAGKEASAKGNPAVSFNAGTGALTLTSGQINFLGTPGADYTDPAYASDPFLGAILQVDGLFLDPTISADDRFAFVGGKLSISKGGVDLLTADVPVLSVLGAVPEGALPIFGVLGNIDAAPPGTSLWLDDFIQEVLDRPPLLPDFFLSSPIDLAALSDGFTISFDPVELDGMGIVGNSAVPEPDTLTMALAGLVLLGACLTCLDARKGRGSST